MDIEFLLWLQNLRESTGNLFTPFVLGYSDVSYTWLLFVPVFIYWCVNKDSGMYLLLSLALSRFINGFIKPTVCAYRPWVRDSRIIPVGLATGYSFPSGHTMWATPVLGGLAVLYRKKFSWLPVVCAILILMTAFARNYLGVHTPQDVVTGTILGLLALWIAAKILNYTDGSAKRENILMTAGLILCVIELLYIEFKPYPMDYIDGKLLVDPVKMMNDSFHGTGLLTGLIAGRYIERRYINFSVTGLNFKGIILALIGFVPYYFMVFTFAGAYPEIWDALTSIFTAHGGRFVLGFSLMFYVTALWPMVIMRFCERPVNFAG